MCNIHARQTQPLHVTAHNTYTIKDKGRARSRLKDVDVRGGGGEGAKKFKSSKKGWPDYTLVILAEVFVASYI